MESNIASNGLYCLWVWFLVWNLSLGEHARKPSKSILSSATSLSHLARVEESNIWDKCHWLSFAPAVWFHCLTTARRIISVGIIATPKAISHKINRMHLNNSLSQSFTFDGTCNARKVFLTPWGLFLTPEAFSFFAEHQYSVPQRKITSRVSKMSLGG